MTRTNKKEHIKPVLKNLHWLPVKDRIDHKSLSWAYNCFSGTAPQYLQELIPRYEPPRSLRSSLLILAWLLQAFSNSALRLWNALPHALRESECSSAFRRKLEIHLFSNQWLHHDPSLRSFVCLCFSLFIIWQRDCPSMCHVHGCFMDVFSALQIDNHHHHHTRLVLSAKAVIITHICTNLLRAERMGIGWTRGR